MKIAINGIGIAGPTLAFWLRKSGHEVLLVEAAPKLRSGGYIVDFWGIGYDIADRMGLIPRIRELGYQIGEVRFVDGKGRKSGGLRTDVFQRLTKDRFTSLRRSDISATLYQALEGKVETIFGDSIAGIEETGGRVRLSFDHAPSREVDLVIGADGLHSRVRGLAFGPEADFEVPLGYYVAAFEAGGYRSRDELVYLSHGIPGRQVSRLSLREDRTLFLFIFREQYLPGGLPRGDAERKTALAEIFAPMGWECPAILDLMRQNDNLYFDRVSQIRMPAWSKGRTALVGDAGACVSLMAGEGIGLAMAEAYVLAGELHASSGDAARAFARYQERLMPFLKRKQAGAAKFASTFAPKSRLGIAFRNRVTSLFRIPFLADYYIGKSLRDEIKLPDYGY